MSKPTSTLPWHLPVSLSEISEGGRHFEIAAPEETRKEIAQLAGVRSLPRLQATFDVKRYGSDGLRVEGEVSATVGQNCVVTLEPLDNEIKEKIHLVFAPPRAPVTTEGDDEDSAEPVGLNDPEPLEGNAIDLGVLATEFLLLGIDPYPRKPDAAFEAPAAADESDHPIAALAELKKGLDSKE